MNTVLMRKRLKDDGHKVPRGTDEMVEFYNQTYSEKDESTVETIVDAIEEEINKEPVETLRKVSNVVEFEKNIYTYVGSGPTPPAVIKYMGIQAFTRGVAQEVTDPRVLAKIGGNASFVKGSVSADYLVEQDKLEEKRVSEIKEEEVKMQIMADRQNRG